MKNKGLLGLLALLAILFFWGCNFQKRLVGLDEGINNKWGAVQSSYQRRGDLIDNLVNTVKGEANFEKSTLESVISARASASSIKLDAKDITPEKLAQFQASQGQLSQALGRLMVVSEQYPQLRANESFKKLMDEISGTENRINRSRDEYNDAVKPYNTSVRQLPGSLIAGMLGFKDRGYFSADSDKQTAPKVDFGTTGATAPAPNTLPANATSVPVPAPNNAAPVPAPAK
jgi:LemA protein